MKKIIEFLPLLTISVIFIGYYNVHSYYEYFNIQIYNYLDTSEIIFAFGSIVLPFSIGLTVWILLFYSFFPSIVKSLFSSSNIEPPSRVWNYVPLIVLCVYMLIVFFLTLKARKIEFLSEVPNVYESTAFLLLVCLPISLVYNWTFKLNMLFADEKGIFTGACFVIFFIIYINAINLARFKMLVVDNKPKYDVFLSLKDGGELRTSKHVIFIGSTKNYFIFRDYSENYIVVIPLSEIRDIKQRPLRRGI